MDEEWLRILACPWCVGRPDPPLPGLAKGALELQGPAGKPEALRCRQCGRVYRIEEGVPNLLIEDATQPEGSARQAG
jgi:uncharacterized protein YbaR (Trm112 family)